MKVIGFLFWAVFLFSACSNSTEESSVTDSLKDTLKVIPERTSVPIKDQLKNGFLSVFYEKGVVSLQENVLFFAFKFDLNNDGGQVPDTYGSYLKFKFEVENDLVFPEEIPFKEKEFSEEESESVPMTAFDGVFKKVVVNDAFVIYSSLDPYRTLVLLNNSEKTGEYAYYFMGHRAKDINGENVYAMIRDAYSDGEMTVEHARSSALSNHKDQKDD